MSPLGCSGSTSSRRSVQFDGAQETDGNGSIRLGTPTVGTPTFEDRAQRHPRFGTTPMLDSGALEKTTPFPQIKPTPAARYGYMPPGAGRIDRSSSQPPQQASASSGLSDALLAKIVKLYQAM